jgi:peroxiredoxin
MANLKAAIDAYNTTKKEKVPAEILAIMDAATDALKASGIEGRALKTGDLMPNFTLPNQNGEGRTLSDYLTRSPVVLNIYRGGWCPYCNMEMKALHDALPAIEARGARLVGMAPEMPDKAITTAERNGLAIDILSDSGNAVAETLGLVFELPAELRPIYEKFGLDIPAYNGDQSFKLPVPATYIVGQDRRIVFDFVNADYTRRVEPDEIVAQLDRLFVSGRQAMAARLVPNA